MSQIVARPEIFEPVAVLMPALERLPLGHPDVYQLWLFASEFLLCRSGQPPAAPKDWSQPVKLRCKCEDCVELQAFMLDPVAQIHRARMNEQRRRHRADRISEHQLAVTTLTEREGSPRTMVCTKDHRFYQRRCSVYRGDIEACARLAALVRRNIADPSDVLERLDRAVGVARNWQPVV